MILRKKKNLDASRRKADSSVIKTSLSERCLLFFHLARNEPRFKAENCLKIDGTSSATERKINLTAFEVVPEDTGGSEPPCLRVTSPSKRSLAEKTPP